MEAAPAEPPAEKAKRASDPDPVPAPTQILRFHASERALHWAIATPFLVCYTTAAILVFFYNPDPQRPLRWVFSWTHRLSAVSFILLPSLVAFRCRGDLRIHLYNIRQAWRWTLSDVTWLAKMGLATINSRFQLPEQGKFNAAEKLNFMLVMTTYPLYILTGILVWLPGIAFFSWILHFFMALVATPFLLGHIFMATLNPSTRAGLHGMFSGFVDRQWAKHHYGDWYREQYEPNANPGAASRSGPAVPEPTPPPPLTPEPKAEDEAP